MQQFWQDWRDPRISLTNINSWAQFRGIWERKHVVCATRGHCGLCGVSGAARSSHNLNFLWFAQNFLFVLNMLLRTPHPSSHIGHHFKWGPAQRKRKRRRKISRYVAIAMASAPAKSNIPAEAEIKSRQGSAQG
jgi:hypothetical protein